mgnify:CR=1 FL=1
MSCVIVFIADRVTPAFRFCLVNSTLAHVFTQVKIYEAANCSDGSLIAIFCFSESEYLYSEQIVKAAGYENMIGESIYLIDCRNDNKPSASIA